MKRNKEIVITKFENDKETGIERFDSEAERKHKKLKMIEELQCPGCTLGSDRHCGSFEEENGVPNAYFKCRNHSAGTRLLGVGKILLGFPRGFNRIGETDTAANVVKLFEKTEDCWGTNANDSFDFPVWKAKHDGRIFLRVISPRIGRVQIHAIDSEDGFENIKCRDVTDLEMD